MSGLMDAAKDAVGGGGDKGSQPGDQIEGQADNAANNGTTPLLPIFLLSHPLQGL